MTAVADKWTVRAKGTATMAAASWHPLPYRLDPDGLKYLDDAPGAPDDGAADQAGVASARRRWGRAAIAGLIFAALFVVAMQPDWLPFSGAPGHRFGPKPGSTDRQKPKAIETRPWAEAPGPRPQPASTPRPRPTATSPQVATERPPIADPDSTRAPPAAISRSRTEPGTLPVPTARGAAGRGGALDVAREPAPMRSSPPPTPAAPVRQPPPIGTADTPRATSTPETVATPATSASETAPGAPNGAPAVESSAAASTAIEPDADAIATTASRETATVVPSSTQPLPNVATGADTALAPPLPIRAVDPPSPAAQVASPATDQRRAERQQQYRPANAQRPPATANRRPPRDTSLNDSSNIRELFFGPGR